MKKFGFIRVGACVPKLRVADVTYNVEEIINNKKESDNKEVAILVFHE